MVIIISKHLLLLLNIYIKVMSTRTGTVKIWIWVWRGIFIKYILYYFFFNIFYRYIFHII